MADKDKAATLADLEKMLGEPVPTEPDEPELTVEKAEPVTTYEQLMAKIEALDDVEYRVVGGMRFGFKRFRDAAEWNTLTRKAGRGREFAERAGSIIINPGEADPEKRLCIKDPDIIGMAHIIFGTLAVPKLSKLDEAIMLSLRGGSFFTALFNAAFGVNGEDAIAAAKKGLRATASTRSRR